MKQNIELKRKCMAIDESLASYSLTVYELSTGIYLFLFMYSLIYLFIYLFLFLLINCFAQALVPAYMYLLYINII